MMKKLVRHTIVRCLPAIVPLLCSGFFFAGIAQAAQNLSITVPPLDRTQQISIPAPPPEIGLAKWLTQECMPVRSLHLFLDRSMAGRQTSPLQSLIDAVKSESESIVQAGLVRAFGPLPNASNIMVVTIETFLSPKKMDARIAAAKREAVGLQVFDAPATNSYKMAGAIIRKEEVHIASDQAAAKPAQNLQEHLIRMIPQFTHDAIAEVLAPENERQIYVAVNSAQAHPFSYISPAAGEALAEEPLIALPPADAEITAAAAAASPPAAPVVAPSAPLATPATNPPTAASGTAVTTVPPLPPITTPAGVSPNIAAPSETQASPSVIPPVPPAEPVATPVVAQPSPTPEPAVAKPTKKPLVKKARTTAKQKFVPLAETPMQETNSPFINGAPAGVGNEIATENHRILNGIPGGIDQKPFVKPEFLNINRASPPSASLTTPENQGDITAKREAMGIAIEVKKPKLDINYELRKAYDAQLAGSSADAIVIYREILDNDADNKQALLGLATSYHRTGQLELARTLYGRVLTLDSTNRVALNNFLVLLTDEAPENALVQLKDLQQRNPEFAAVPAQIAVVYQKLRQPDKAIESMSRAVQLAPSNLSYRYNLAVLLDRQHHYEQAAALYSQIIEATEHGEKSPGNIQQIQQRLTFIRSNKP
ncbi:MAG: hypothetical protein EBR02_01440 [Alphaproteobacteria bacterium]|nr:hypothetical protein [Alphaproteobacteria bacterium]